MNGAEVLLSAKALRQNLLEVQRLLGANRFCYAVVKSEAYGHGMVEIASLLYGYGQRHFAVSTLQEGVTLREAAGIQRDAEVLVLGRLEGAEWEAVPEYGLTGTLHDEDDVDALIESGCRQKEMTVHVKVDVGMRRLGVRAENLASLREKLCTAGLDRCVTGWMTHFDSAGNDLAATRAEWKAFREVIERVVGPRLSGVTVHCANSASAVALEETRESAARIGLLLYGYRPKWECDLKLTPVMTVRGRIVMEKKVQKGEGISYDQRFVAQREMRVGVVNFGYAHGYPWRIENAEMVVRGHRVPVVGAVTMDYTMVDLTGLPEAHRGDAVEVMGREVTAQELAQKSGTLVYDILCRLGRHTRKKIAVVEKASGQNEDEGSRKRREEIVPGTTRLAVQKSGGQRGEQEVNG